MARLDPVAPGAWPPEMADALAALRPPSPRHAFPARDGRPKGLNLLGTFAHHPAAARAFHTLAGHVLFATTLDPRQRELLVLRVAARRDASYEWLQHVVLGRDAGLSDDEIARASEGPAAGWTGLDRALLQAADELLEGAAVSDATWAELSAGLDPPQLVDVVLTVGTYDALAMVLGAFAVDVEDDLRAVWKPASP